MATGPADQPRPRATAAQIRPVRIEDVAALNEIRRQPSALEGTLALPSERIEDSRGFVERLGADDHLMVAELDGQLVGMAGLHVKRGKMRHGGELGIAVAERFQGRGIGRQLMQALLDLADNYLGLVRVELEVNADNARAIALYESLGFEREGCRRKAIFRRGRYLDLLIMGRLSGDPTRDTPPTSS